ncbi:type III-B CRISPR module-associated protein Cmr5 [Thermodesulforhabdus norvegica]|uniref:CRISPR type III-B/RAMP module-associated protein Cmr5 n=1 Tax=Thermodesulforhabdus norvegica TaxID=39841 RepID=A0A1I4TAD0_9BACT|nr:type III-B CRISPR module-associated protein Cmr5 [Thermodesulforhabdus norvegica]SFM73748.1 CRISPR-associated protein Cmr5 [Thermodesulforhabdus norvegica]
MKTVSQERAGFAYDKAAKAVKKVDARDFSSFVAGLPAMILQNGLGHTLCFLLAKAADQNNGKYKRDEKHYLAFEAVAGWLSERKMLRFDSSKPTDLINEICRKNSSELMAMQEEALRFLEWFKVMSKMFVEERENAEA